MTTSWTLLSRFYAKTRTEGACLVWTCARNGKGYGQIRVARKRLVQVHRLALEWSQGPLSAGSEVNHRCRNRACVRVDHLELLTKAEHMRVDRAQRLAGSRRRGLLRRKRTDLPEGVTPNGSRFMARIRRGGRVEYLGSYATPAEAGAVYQAEFVNRSQ